MLLREGKSLEFKLQDETVVVPLDLLRKYNVSAPRYTSYPTAPEWKEGGESYAARLRAAGDEAAPFSVYTHIPFCEERCHFCGCNVVITKYHEQADKYLDYLLRDLDATLDTMAGNRAVNQYHWGGGTPTYFNETQIRTYFEACRDRLTFSPDAEIAIETDPRVTTTGQLDLLRDLGFNRISYGVQSFDPAVQAAINRVQPYDMVKHYYDACRERGFDAVNFDLIYGLPEQTLERFTRTVELTLGLRPDRIALYNFAHLPEMLPHQKRMDGSKVLTGLDKFQLFATAVELFTSAGYRYIGLDHFALESDELAVAEREGSLNRNFMGHTTQAGADLVSLGVSAISMFDDAYYQNEKKLAAYYRRLDDDKSPVYRAIRLSDDDRLRREVIQGLLCNGVIRKRDVERRFGIDFDAYFAAARADLDDRIADGLATESADEIRATALGRVFNRNIAVMFDAYYQRPTGHKAFSKTV